MGATCLTGGRCLTLSRQVYHHSVKRYPPVALTDSDMFGLMVSVLNVRSHMADVKSQVSTIVSQMKKMKESRRHLVKCLNSDVTSNQLLWPSWPLISNNPCRPHAVYLAVPPAVNPAAPPAVSGSTGSNQSALSPSSSSS